MKFSVIICTFNRKEWLRDALRSALSQTYKPYELIVVDDGSQEDIASLVSEFNSPNIKFFRQNNTGIIGARKKGIDEASGNWIALLDSDDIWTPNYLQDVVRLKSTFPEIEFSISNFQDFNKSGLTDYVRFDSIPLSFWNAVTERKENDFLLLKEDCYLHFLEHQPGFSSGMTFSMNAYDKIGGMNMKIGRRLAEDAYFCRKLTYNCRVGYIKKVQVHIRKHSSNMSSDKLKNHIDKTYILNFILQQNDLPLEYKKKTEQTIHKWNKQIFNIAFELDRKEITLNYFKKLKIIEKLGPKTLAKAAIAQLFNSARKDKEE